MMLMTSILPSLAIEQYSGLLDDTAICSGGVSAMRLGNTTNFDDDSTCKKSATSILKYEDS